MSEQMTYEEVRHEWGGNTYKDIDYKGRSLSITLKRNPKNNEAWYLGEFESKDYRKRRRSIESVHYEKVISKFKKFVEEYCTDWVDCTYWDRRPEISYKCYKLTFRKEFRVDNYFGTCEIHKNSTFKCISSSMKEIEDKFKLRVDKIIEGKEKAEMAQSNVIKSVGTDKECKIAKIEAKISKLKEELDKLNTKEIYTYKGATITIDYKGESQQGWLIGRIQNYPEKNPKYIYGLNIDQVKEEFETFLNKLEEQANLYCQLTGNKISLVFPISNVDRPKF